MDLRDVEDRRGSGEFEAGEGDEVQAGQDVEAPYSLLDMAADAAVSAGNTGAMMAMAKLALRTMPGIDRPALAALLPTLGDTDMVMLDLGANTECDAQNLVQFAVMGSAYARTVLSIGKPRVKLLNIGTEELKGTDELKEAAALLIAREDRPLPALERVALRLHLAICGACPRFERQLLTMRNALDRWRHYTDE